MEKKLIISGFGGQGIVFAGKLLAESAMRDSLQSTYFPSYGVAMRGGAAKSDVVVSDEEIGSPVIDAADVIISMSIEAKHKYEPLLKENGILILNTSLVKEDPQRTDIEAVSIDATEMASDMGNKMVATLICVGYAAQRIECISIKAFFESLEQKVSKFGEKMLKLNETALKTGWELK
jgi:2-oxoglutarate ferredoxin oxidoreductase subunit gamma